jgi:hypothetical protein
MGRRYLPIQLINFLLIFFVLLIFIQIVDRQLFLLLLDVWFLAVDDKLAEFAWELDQRVLHSAIPER